LRPDRQDACRLRDQGRYLLFGVGESDAGGETTGDVGRIAEERRKDARICLDCRCDHIGGRPCSDAMSHRMSRVLLTRDYTNHPPRRFRDVAVLRFAFFAAGVFLVTADADALFALRRVGADFVAAVDLAVPFTARRCFGCSDGRLLPLALASLPSVSM
jgi:hypothetical protein